MNKNFIKVSDFLDAVQKKLLIRIILIIFSLIGVYSSIIGIFQSYNNIDKALQYHEDAMQYYANGEYEKVIENEEKAYKINRHLNEVIFYYVMGLINTEEEFNISKAKDILMINEKYLSDNERVLYGFLKWYEGNYNESIDILESIEDPLELETPIFNKYIVALSDSSFNMDYQQGRKAFNECSKLITLKKNTLGVFLGESIFQIPGTMVINQSDLLTNDLMTVKETNISLASIYMRHTNGISSIEEKLAVFNNSSEDFDFFYKYNENVVNNYLFYFNELLRTLGGNYEGDGEIISSIFDNLLVKGSEHRIMMKKLKLLKNIVSDTYDYNLPKENFELLDSITTLGLLNFENKGKIDKFSFSANSIIGEKEYLGMNEEFDLSFGKGKYVAEIDYSLIPLVTLDNKKQYYYYLIPCFFESK